MEETLDKYKALFEEHLTGKDVKKLADIIEVSVSTIYRFLGEYTPTNGISKGTANRIMEEGKSILKQRSEILLKKLS